MASQIQPYLQLALNACNLLVLIYAFIKFTKRPHDTLEQRVTVMEVDVKEIKQSLKQGNDRFKEHDTTLEILLKTILALLEFEVHYCETEHKPISKNLEKAKNDLNDYLSKV